MRKWRILKQRVTRLGKAPFTWGLACPCTPSFADVGFDMGLLPARICGPLELIAASQSRGGLSGGEDAGVKVWTKVWTKVWNPARYCGVTAVSRVPRDIRGQLSSASLFLRKSFRACSGRN